MAASSKIKGKNTRSSLEHLRENLRASTIEIPSEVLADLDVIGGDRDSKEV